MKCKRTVCTNEGTCEHTLDGGFYCFACARQINWYAGWAVITLPASPERAAEREASDDVKDVHSTAEFPGETG